ncbi:MAG: peptidoglycan DD-metalloendopeptidase family protein [Myxococcota bacterium]
MGSSACGPRVPEPVARPALRARHRIHVVASGENLYRIALRYQVELDALMALNQIRDPTGLQVGQELLIPGERPLSGPGPLDRGPRAASAVRIEGCGFGRDRGPTSVHGLQWPVDGVLLARFGQKDGLPHRGIDIAAPLGSPVRSAEDGRVVFVGEQPGFGQLIVIEGQGGRLTLYGRNQSVCVVEGKKVKRGEGIGRVGDQGTGVAYLYFEVREGEPVNPLLRLP